MKKIQIIVLAGAGVLSFAATFGITWFLKGDLSTVSDANAQQMQNPADPAGDIQNFELKQLQLARDGDKLSKGMTERQLRSLIYDIREKLKDHSRREKELQLRQEEIQAARQMLQEDIDRMDNLRVQLGAAIAALKQQEDYLKKTMIEISANEQANMKHIAGTYDKMDVSQAGKIMINMATSNQIEDAVKILHYMSQRNAGKLIGEIGNTQAELASLLCLKLKQIKEDNT